MPEPEEETTPTRPDVLEEARKLVRDDAEATRTKNRVAADLNTFKSRHLHAIWLVEGHNFCHREVGSAWSEDPERERNVRDLVLITDIKYTGTSLEFIALSLSVVNKYGESREWRFNLSEISSFEVRHDFMAGLRGLAKTVLAEVPEPAAASDPVEPVPVGV